jgi:Na+/proline symporter
LIVKAFLGDSSRNFTGTAVPDIFAKRYGKVVELLVSVTTIISFIMLLAGNLVGMGVILAYLWQIEESGAIWISSAVVWAYTVCGGLFSVAYTDVIQGGVGWTGVMAFAYYFIVNESPSAPPPSIGFPGKTQNAHVSEHGTATISKSELFLFYSGYIYPDGVGDGGICDMYQGVPCNIDDPSTCCYNEGLWCPEGLPNCNRYDRGAYPFGDERVYEGQMTDRLSMSPLPNAILWNWATIFILGFGNLAALDFQARCMASKTPKVAKLGCLIAACVTLMVGVPMSFLGSIIR